MKKTIARAYLNLYNIGKYLKSFRFYNILVSSLLVYTNVVVAGMDNASNTLDIEMTSFFRSVSNCKATYKLAAVKSKSGSYVTAHKGWADRDFPKVTLNGECRINVSGSTILIEQVHSKSTKNWYFFYVQSLGNDYAISAQPLLKYTHAQWVVTENASFQIKTNTFSCFESKEIELCLEAKDTQ